MSKSQMLDILLLKNDTSQVPKVYKHLEREKASFEKFVNVYFKLIPQRFTGKQGQHCLPTSPDNTRRRRGIEHDLFILHLAHALKTYMHLHTESKANMSTLQKHIVRFCQQQRNADATTKMYANMMLMLVNTSM